MTERRIFLAIEISDAVRAACGSHIKHVHDRFPDVPVGWESPEKMHITLKFLGNIDNRLLQKLQDGVSQIAENNESFRLRLSRSGVFPRPTRPRILWIGAEVRIGTVTPLYDELETFCEGLGFARETRAFRPHITIGRVRDPDKAADLAALHLTTKIEAVDFEVSQIVIYESKLQPTGSVYSAVSQAKLTGNKRFEENT